MTWLEITINTTEEDLEHLIARLSANGAEQIVIEDEADFQQFLKENQQYWDYVDEQLLQSMQGVARVKFYVTDDPAGHQQLKQYTAGLDSYEVLSAPLQEEDWATSWQKYYKPLAVGRRLYIVPEWEKDKPLPEGRLPIWMNPGLTFGTGNHASTQLCLEALEQKVQPGDRVLDLGCGSGILSIAAFCLRAGAVDAVDIDPKAADVAKENAGLNQIQEDRFRVYAGNILTDQGLQQKLSQQPPYQIVLANIVADVIIQLAPLLKMWLAENGIFICSGIINTRLYDVVEALQNHGFQIAEMNEKSDWCALTCKRIQRD